MNELYRATKSVFGYMSFFDQDWEEGWRPMLDVGNASYRNDQGGIVCDILYISRFGAYVRARASDNVDIVIFHTLYEMCEKQNLHARRNRIGNHERSIDMADHPAQLRKGN